MRYLFRPVLLLLAAALLAGCDADKPLPPDPDTLTGTLDNGIVYFVRRNALPTNRVELRLVVRAGSVLEDDDQQGLAHVLEHMAFNGTARFDKQQLVDYLESIGMRFGPDLNAYTSFDQTAYILQVPVDKPGALETGFQILSDWAFAIENEDGEIEQERRVVIEEWRLGRGAGQRIRDRQFPVLFQGSRYADRLPIGKKEVLDTFAPQRVRDFYAAWYRPASMGVMAIGDADTATLLAHVKTHFGRQAPRATDRPLHDVPAHAEPRVSIVSDPEATGTHVAILHKRPPEASRSAADFRRDLMDTLIETMLRQRLDEAKREPDAPFIHADVWSGRWILGAAMFGVNGTAKDNAGLPALRRLLAVEEQARRFGFADSELRRARDAVRLRAERTYAERAKTESTVFADAYTHAFVFDETIPSAETQLRLTHRILPTIARDDVVARALQVLATSNRVVTVSGPDKPGITLPTEAECLDLLAGAADADIAPYIDAVADAPLLATPPPPGAIAVRTYDKRLDVHTWTLSNGMTVLLKATPFKQDEILISVFSPGGHSTADDDAFIAASSAAEVVQECGFGQFSRTALDKKLMGTAVSVTPYVHELRSGIEAGCRPDDLETCLQLIHLAFTAPRRDPEAFAALRDRKRESLRHRLGEPETAFWDCVKFTLAGKHPRRAPWTPETVDRMDLDASLAFYAARFGDAAGFTVILVGAIDPRSIDGPIGRYLASLPAADRKEAWRDIGVRAPTGTVTEVVAKGSEPKGRVHRVYGTAFEWSPRARRQVEAMLHILQIRLREKLRETIGGTYHAAVYPLFEQYPVPTCESRISFGCDPAAIPAMTAAMEAEVATMQSTLVDDVHMTKAREIMVQAWRVGLERNAVWKGLLDAWRWHGEYPGESLDRYEQWLGELTPETIRETARRRLGTPNVATILLKPETPTETAPEDK